MWIYCLKRQKKEIQIIHRIVIRFLSEKERDIGQTLSLSSFVSFSIMKQKAIICIYLPFFLLHHRIQCLLMGHRFAFLDV